MAQGNVTGSDRGATGKVAHSQQAETNPLAILEGVVQENHLEFRLKTYLFRRLAEWLYPLLEYMKDVCTRLWPAQIRWRD